MLTHASNSVICTLGFVLTILLGNLPIACMISSSLCVLPWLLLLRQPSQPSGIQHLASAAPSNPLALPYGTTHAHWTSRLTYAIECLASLDRNPIAHFPRAQKRLASIVHLSRWHQALLCASPVQRSILHSFSQRGGTMWLEPARARSLFVECLPRPAFHLAFFLTKRRHGVA